MLFELFFTTPLDPKRPLQSQIQERLVEAVLSGLVSAHEPLPATRLLARRLKVSRNTVSLVYERLADDGYLRPVSRRGYFIDDRWLREQRSIRVGPGAGSLRPVAGTGTGTDTGAPVDYARRLQRGLADQRNITKPADWRRFDYPFVYGQVAPDRTSVSRWRDCIRQAGTVRHSDAWISDLVDADDPMLVEQIIRRLLPTRGFRAGPEEILVTVGSQSALYLAAALLCGPGSRVAVEEPGYVDARNIFLAQGAQLVPQRVDADGLRLAEDFPGADLLYVTPGHQSPTCVTMSLARRLALLAAAETHDFLVIEDDYEHELNFLGAQHPALKSFDRAGRVLHVGSLSKPLFPGLRLGFVAAPAPLVRELRALRRLMYRHPSALDQRAMAIFLADGHFAAHIRRQRRQLSAKWKTMLVTMNRLFPGFAPATTAGGSAFWIVLPPEVDARLLAQEAASRGVLVEPGDVHYLQADPPRNRLRLGFAAIAEERIVPGLEALAEALAAIRRKAG